MARFDAVVVGAGPAGSTAARELAASGARVLVLDKSTFPRYKACGGGIPLRTERLLPFPIDVVVEDSVNLLEVSLRGRSGFVRDSGSPFARMVMRDRFDDLLLEWACAAGAQFRPLSTVRVVDSDSDELTVRCDDSFEAQARFLVCADGAHSPTGKMTGLGEGIAECAAWEVEFEGSATNRARWSGRAFVDVGYSPWGYGWLFPKEKHLSVGMVLPGDNARELKGRVAALAERIGVATEPTAISRGHKIRFRRENEPIAGARALLAGDAAGLADEFTEEGIVYALQSGRLAARNLLRALDCGPGLASYQEDVNSEIMPELKAARYMAGLFYAGLRRGGRGWFTAARLMPGLWSAFFAVQRGESSYAREVTRFWFVRLARRLQSS